MGMSLQVPRSLSSGPPLVYFLSYVKGVLLAEKYVAILSNFARSWWSEIDWGSELQWGGRRVAMRGVFYKGEKDQTVR